MLRDTAFFYTSPAFFLNSVERTPLKSEIKKDIFSLY